MKKTMLTAAVLLLTIVSMLAQPLKESVTWNNIRNHPAPLPVIGEIKARPSELEAPSMWSVGLETMDRDYAIFDNFSEYVGSTGVGYGRLQSGWAKTEMKKGKYDFAWLDAHIDGVIAQGIRPWVCLCYGNPIYSEHGHDLNAKLFKDGPIMDAWLDYVRIIVKRYKGKVSMWEVWNEPDGRKNLDSFELYANLFVRTAKVIKEVDPSAKIAAFGSCSPDRKYIRQSLEYIDKAGGIPFIDYITYHAYWPIPELIVPAVRQLREDVDKYSRSIGLLQGETGCPAQLEYGHAMRDLEWNEYSQVKWDLRQSLVHFSMGIPYSFFTMVDLDYGWMLQSFGLIRMNGDKKPVYKRPKYYMVQHVTSIFTPELSASYDVMVTISGNPKYYSTGICKDGKKVGCLIWLCGDRPSDSLDRHLMDVRISGTEMKDPVYIDLITGYIHSLNVDERNGTIGIKDLPLWDAPILIIDRAVVHMTSK